MAGKGKKANKQKERLLSELTELLPAMDEEGLIFLIRQAQVHIHNMQVDRLNQEMEELHGKETGGGKKSDSGNKGFGIEIELAENGKTYYFIVNGRKHFLDLEETQKIVQLCYRPPTKSSALKFLYQFFSQRT